MFIYKITNSINNKIYIGKTCDTVEKRWLRHIKSTNNGCQLYFHRAIRKYGAKIFILETIDYASNKDELCLKEKYWINYYQSFKNEVGYNLTMGGEGGALTGEALEKMKIHRRGQKPSEETLKKRSASLKGKLLGKKNPMYHKKPANYGKTLDEMFGDNAAEIRNKIKIKTKEGMLKSEKYQKYLKRLEEKYYTHPKFCRKCGKMIKYKSSSYKFCEECECK